MIYEIIIPMPPPLPKQNVDMHSFTLMIGPQSHFQNGNHDVPS